MRCLACNNILSDFEATRRYADSGKFVDLCNKCFATIDNFPDVIERADLPHEDVLDDEELIGEDIDDVF